MAKSVAFANDCLDAFFDNGASGSLSLGPVASRVVYTLPMKARFTTTVCTDTTPGTEFTGGGYAPVSLAGSMGAASSKSKSSNAALSISNMPAGTWNDVYVTDSTATPKYVAFRGGSGLGKNVNAGDTALIPSGSFTATEG